MFGDRTASIPAALQASWKAEVRARWELTRRRQGAFRVKADVTMKVIGWETVQVPAGTFRALKLEGRGTYQRLDTFASGQTHWLIWYSPEARRWVRLTYQSTDSRHFGAVPGSRIRGRPLLIFLPLRRFAFL